MSVDFKVGPECVFIIKNFTVPGRIEYKDIAAARFSTVKYILSHLDFPIVRKMLDRDLINVPGESVQGTWLRRLYINFFTLMTSDTDRPETHKFDLEKITLANTYYRRVISTNLSQQLVLMCLQPGRIIDYVSGDVETFFERHDESDQFIRLEAGQLTVSVVNEETQELIDYDLTDGMSITIISGQRHRVTNGTGVSHLYTIYSLPHHKIGTLEP